MSIHSVFEGLRQRRFLICPTTH